MTPTPDHPQDPAAQEASAAARLDGVLAAAEREIAAILAAAETAASADLEARSADLDAQSSRLEAREAEADARARHLDDRHRSLDERARVLDARQDELDALTAELVQRRAALEVRDTELTEISAGLLTSAVAAQEHARRLMDLPPLAAAPAARPGAGALTGAGAHGDGDGAVGIETGPSTREIGTGGRAIASVASETPSGAGDTGSGASDIDSGASDDRTATHGDAGADDVPARDSVETGASPAGDEAPDARRPAEPSPRVRVRHLRDASDPDAGERSAPVGPRPSTPAGLREVPPRESRWDTVAGAGTRTGADPVSTGDAFADHGSLPIVGGSSDEDLTVDGTAEGDEIEDAALTASEVEAPEAQAAGDRTDVGQAGRAPSSGDAAEADRAPGSDDAVAAGDTSSDDVEDDPTGVDTDDPTPEAGVETDPPEKLDSARLAALSMAAEGRSREEVEAVLRDDLKIIDHASLIDYVFGISTPSSIVPSWPPRRRRRS